MTFQTYSYSNNGGKKNNEDYCLCGGSIWLMASGAGRNGTERSVSASALSLFYEDWREAGSPTDEEALRRITDSVSEKLSVFSERHPRICQAGITMAAAVFEEPTLRFFSVGNTRVYLFKNGRLQQRTRDDTVSGALCAAGYFPYEDIRTHSGRRFLLRSMESRSCRNGIINIQSAALEPGDAMLLCTDGFWEQIYEMETEIDLSKSDDPKQWMTYMVKRILLKKNKEKTDCFSATCVMAQA